MRIRLAREFVSRGHRVAFWLLRDDGELRPSVPETASVVDLRVAKLRAASAPIAAQWERERPDAVLAAMWPLTTMAALARRRAGKAGRSARLLLSEHTMLSQTPQAGTLAKRLAMRTTIALSHREADVVVAVSEGVADDLADLGLLRRDRITIINNPAADGHFDHNVADPWPSVASPRLLAIGRMKDAKDYPTLLRAFAKLAAADTRPTLAILGTGPEEDRVRSLVQKLGLADRVLLPGFVAEPAGYLAHADLFVMSSVREGFGNVLVEALQAGLPIVSTDCRSGPSEILDRGRFGTLVPVGDADALAAAITKALSESIDPAAQRACAAKFTVERIADRYLAALFPGD